MKQSNATVLKAPAARAIKGSASARRLSDAAFLESIGWGDSILNSFRTRLFHGFRTDFKHDSASWAAATRVIVHAIRTFGSEEKAHSWLISRCGALGNAIPYDFLKAGKCGAVDEELDRIDYGVYV